MEEKHSSKYCGLEKNISRLKERRKVTFEFERKVFDRLKRKYELSAVVPLEHFVCN